MYVWVTPPLVTARQASATGVLVPRADSAYYGYDVVAAALRHGARFSINARQDWAVRAAIAGIADDAWTTIQVDAEKAYRAHAIVEQVIADLKNGPLAHLPSGHFPRRSLAR